MALYRWQHILSIWLNQHEIIKHKAGGWRKNGSVYSSILSPLLLLATCRLLQTVGKYLMEALIQNRWRRERTRGRTRRFVSNRFGQNVSPISRFASVWLPLAKLGEQRNSMNMLSQGSVGWEFEFQQHQPTAYSCNIYAPALETKKNWRKKVYNQWARSGISASRILPVQTKGIYLEIISSAISLWKCTVIWPSFKDVRLPL